MNDVNLLRFGKRVRAARQRRGLTQAALGELAHVPRERVVRVEQGHPGVAIGACMRIARALGLEITLTPVSRPTIEEIGEILDGL